jgi:hypothetical protein
MKSKNETVRKDSKSNGTHLSEEKEVAAKHLHMLIGPNVSGIQRVVSVVEFSDGELEEEPFWHNIGIIPRPRFVRPLQGTPDAVLAAGATTIVIGLRRDTSKSDREFLLKHAVTHVALGHVRPGDHIAHWDVLSRLKENQRLSRWDLQVSEHLAPTNIHEPEPFFAEGLTEIWSRLQANEIDPPHTSAVLLRESYSNEIVEVPRSLSEDAQLFPHQARGIAELIARLRRFNTSILADSVGLGKTRTTCAVIRMLRDNGSQRVSAILTPRKLERNWRKEMSVVGLKEGHDVILLNKDIFKRLSVQEAAQQLRGVGLIVVEEAHQD